MNDNFGPQAIGHLAALAAALAPDAEQDDEIVEVNQTAFVQVSGPGLIPTCKHADEISEVNRTVAIEIGRAGWGTRVGGAFVTRQFATKRNAGRGGQIHTVASTQAARFSRPISSPLLAQNLQPTQGPSSLSCRPRVS